MKSHTTLFITCLFIKVKYSEYKKLLHIYITQIIVSGGFTAETHRLHITELHLLRFGTDKTKLAGNHLLLHFHSRRFW